MPKITALLIFVLTASVFGQNWLDVYGAQIKQCRNLNQVDSLIHVFEKRLQNQPKKLLQFYQSVFRFAYPVRERQIKRLSSKNEDELIKKGRAIEQQFTALSDTIYPRAAALCEKIDPDSLDEDLRLYCKTFKIMAERLRFEQELHRKPRPDFAFVDLFGKPHRLYDFKGHYILLHFWNMHSTPCVEELPYLRKAYRKYAPQGLVIINFHITVGHPDAKWEAEALKNFIQETEMPGLHVSGKQALKIKEQYFVQNFPTLFLLNPECFVITPSDKTRRVKSELQGERLLKALEEVLER